MRTLLSRTRRFARLRRRSEKKLRALLASMDDRIVIFDAEGTFIEVVATNCALGHLDKVPRVGKRVHDLLPAAEAELVVGCIRSALAEKRTMYHDYSLAIDGRRIWFSAAVSPLSESRVLWVARDITARKELETELELRVEQRTRDLKATEARFRSIFEQANDVIFTLTRDRKITSLNPAFTRVTGYAVGDWLARDFVDLVAPEHRPAAGGLFTRALLTGSLEVTIATILGARGQRLVLEASLIPQIINGENVGFLGFARDVTKREYAEVERRRNEEQLAESQRIAKLGSWEMDLATGRLWWSDEKYRILGMQRGETPLTYADFIRMLVPEDQARIDGIVEELLALGSHEWELCVRTPEGVEKVLHCRGRVTEKGAQGRIVGTVQDISEKREAQERLREGEERFRLLARATSDAVWDHDPQTGTVWRGEGYETLFGYPAGSIAPNVDAFRELVHPDDLAQLTASFREAVDSGQPSFTHEYRFRRADGTYANILDRGYVVRDREGKPIRIVGAMIDLTEREQMADQLEQAKRLSSLGRLAGSIAHEFNNVLMGVQANAEVIARRAPEPLRNVVDNVTGAVRRGRRITEEILRFMRPADPAPQALGLRRFLGEWADEIRPTLRDRLHVRIEVAGEDELCVLADPQQIAQVFTNMAFNSRDAMPESGGTLWVRAEAATSYSTFAFGVIRSPDRFVHFRITDDGAGIPREQLPHVFEPLFTTKRGGTGLGLAVSYQIVARSDGHIFAESEPDIGTTFHVFLPRCLPEPERVESADQPDGAALGRVLLVEDEPEVAEGVSMLLEADGAEVEVVHTGAETVPAIERFAPDVVILDIGLPDADGVEVYERIAARWPDLRVLFSSGHAQARNLEALLLRPNVALLVKPYEMADLRAALGRLREVAAT